MAKTEPDPWHKHPDDDPDLPDRVASTIQEAHDDIRQLDHNVRGSLTLMGQALWGAIARFADVEARIEALENRLAKLEAATRPKN